MREAVEVREIGSRREPFVDDWLLERLDGVALELNPPTRRGATFAFDEPWEGPSSHYVTMLAHGGEYRSYYRGWRDGQDPVTAVATSRDGVRWEKPRLGIVEWRGSRENNIIWAGEESHTFAPFVDANPDAAASERFKAVAVLKLPRLNRRWGVLMAYVSEDGYRWRRRSEEPILTDGAFDSHNTVQWDAHRGRYVAFFRDFRDGVRTIKTATSPDFLHWSAVEWLDFGDTPPEHLYTNSVIPHPGAPHLFVGFPRRFVPGRKLVPDHPVSGVSDGVFMASRDGVRWDRRFLEAFVRPGRDIENWTDRNNSVAWGMLETAPDELSVYWDEHFRHPTARLARGTVRRDGVVSLRAGYRGGEAVTRPLRFHGRELRLNYATSAVGSVRVEVQDETGRPIPGFTLGECPEIYGDALDGVVRWNGGADVGTLAGRVVRLRLVLRDADVYALRFVAAAAAPA